jgi:putative oxidoreductase
MSKRSAIIQLYLRLALGIDFLVLGLDRLGVWGPYGSPNVSWGDWAHFSAYAHQVMPFLPGGLAEAMAVLATIGELLFGALLVIGWFTRWAAIGSGLLTLCFALSMIAAFGITSPINYSVFPVSAGSLLLTTLPAYPWSVDAWRSKRREGKE